MCRFKGSLSTFFFNGVHVSIHPMCRFKLVPIFIFCKRRNFNTSYVSVQEKQTTDRFCIVGFQYILCVGSSYKRQTKRYWLSIVSIHPMCRFKNADNEKIRWINAFQYILCVGSSLAFYTQKREARCFNTSYVSVQGHFSTAPPPICRNVSIHPMCRFKYYYTR